jgi:hypothetical protein
MPGKYPVAVTMKMPKGNSDWVKKNGRKIGKNLGIFPWEKSRKKDG